MMKASRTNRSAASSLGALSVTTSTLALLAVAFVSSSAHAQTYSGNDTTSGPFSSGLQQFNDSSTLDAAAADTVTGGHQIFNNSSRLEASVAKAVSGGLQNFKQTSVLNARATNTISGGQQDFDDDSVMNILTTRAIGGGMQYFRGSSILNANVADAIGGGTQTFFQSAALNVRVAGALNNTNALIFSNQVGGGIGGFLFLNDHDTILGRITSAALNSGWISNGGTSNVTLVIDSSLLGDSLFSGVIADGGGTLTLVKRGSGTLELSGSDGYSGGTRIEAGTLRLRGGGSLGSQTGSLTIDSGAVLDLGGASGRVGGLSGGGTITTTQPSSNGHLFTVLDQPVDTTFSGVIRDGVDSGAGGAPIRIGLRKTGAGTLTLSGDNSYTGGTSVDGGGRLNVGDANGGSIIGDVSVNDQGTLGGRGSISGQVTVKSGGKLSGMQGQTLTMAGLVLDADSRVAVTLGAPASTGLFMVTGALTLDGTLDVTGAGGFGNGLYRLFDAGSITDGGLAVGATPAGYAAGDLSVQTTANQVNLLVATGAPAGYTFWDGPNAAADNIVNGGTGTWSVSGTNWTNAGGSTNGAYDPVSMLIFQGTPGTVTVDAGGGALAVNGGMQFFVNGYTVTGNALNLAAPVVPIRVGDGTSAGAGMTATVASALTGSGGIDKTDLGTLVLTGASTYSGGTTISAGTLKVAGNATLGAATNGLTIASGATLVFDTTALTIGSLSGSGTVTRSDFNPGVLTVDQASDTSFSGAIDDYFDEINGVTTMTGLTKSGTGTLTLSGNNAYTGATNVTGGTLLVDGSLGNVMWGPIQLGTSQVAVASGGSLGGTGSIAGGVSVASGGILLGRASQTLSMGSLALNTGSVVDVLLGAPGNTRLFNVAGNLTLGGTLNVADAGGFGNGLYRLFDYGGTLTDNGMSVGATPAGFAAGDLTVQTSVANQVNLLVGAVAPGSYSFWNGAQTTANNMVNGGTGIWSATGTNWTNASGSASGVYDPVAMLIFQGVPGTVTVSAAGGALDVDGGMQFFVGGYQVSGDALNLTAATTPIRVGDGTAAGTGMTAIISSALTGSGGFDKTDLGTLTLTGASTFNGEITVNGGALAIRNGGSVSNGAGVIAKEAGAKGTVTIDGASSTWTTGSGVLVGVGANSSGTLNITNGGSVLQVSGDGIVGDGATGTATVDGAGSKWINSGITSAIQVGIGGGSGTLSIINGGRVSDTYGQIGSSGDGTVTVDGPGSTWINTSNLNVGAFGSGTLNITSGGSVSSATAVIGNGSGANGTVTIDGAGSWTNNGTLVVGQGGAGTLNLNGAAGTRGVLETQGITKGQGTGAINFDGGILRATTFNADLFAQFAAGDVTIKAGGAFIDSNGGSIGISAPLGGVGALIKQGAGTLALTGINSYAGGTIVDSGILQVSADGTLGATTGALSIAGGATLDLGGTSQRVGALSGAGNITSTILVGNVSWLTVNQNVDTSFTGSISDGFDPIVGGATTIGLTKSGLGRLTLAGVNEYSGATTVDGGELRIDGAIASGTTVNAGGILSGGGSITSSVAIANGGTLSGAAGSTLTMNSLTLNSGSNVDVALGAPSTVGLFDVTGSLTLDGTLNVSDAGGFGNGLYRLFDAGAVTDNGLAIGTTPAGYAAGELTVQTTANQVNLVVGTSTGPGSFAFWNGTQTTSNNAVNGGTGIWSLAGTNWTNASGSASGVYDPTAMLIFQGAPGAVTVDAGGGALDISGGMQFFVGGYQLSGDALNFTAPDTTIRVGDGTAAGAGTTATISSALTGSGGLDKTDLGTLILTGTNSYGGGTTISGGTLQLGKGGTAGSILGNVANNGVLAFDRSDVMTFSGTISGSGALDQIGTGTTILAAANSYTGSTTVSGGTLAIAATGGITSDVTNNAAFRNAGTVAGRVTNNAGATLTQTGGSISNGVVNAGTVDANGGALNGAIANKAGGSFTVGGTVTGNGVFDNANGATLVVTATGGYTIAGLLTNSGGVTVAQGGSLTAPAGIRNNAGGVITNDGIVTDALDNAGTVTNNGTYNANVTSNTGTINNSAGATWNGNFNTAGIVNNAGTINGNLTQNGGTTTNVGAITGTVTIASGLFTGTGSVGGMNIAGGATIAPGAGGGIGTINVAGTITFNRGAIYQVAVNAAGQASRINAAGQVVLNGGTVNVLAGAGNYRPQTDYTILSATSGVSGTFTSVTSNLAFLDPSLRYDAGNVYLRLRRNDISFAGIGQTPNQVAVGVPTETLGWGNQVFDAVVNLSAPQARDAFDQLSGDIHPSMRTVMLEDSRFVRNAVWERLRGSAGGDGYGAWGQAIGSWGHIGSDGNAARLDRSAGGLLMGIDAAAGGNIRLGAVGGYSRTSVDARGSGKIDSYHLGAYAGGQWGPASIRAGIAYSWQDIHTTRVIAFPGFGDTARASYNGGTFQAFGELGYGFDLGRAKVEPYANLAYARARTSGFSETGGGARLAGARATTEVTFTTLGLRSATGFDLGGAGATLRVGAGWRHAFGDAAPVTWMGYRAGGGAFPVAGLPITGNAALIDAGLDIAISDRTIIGISYGGQFGTRLSDQTAKASLTFRF